MGSLQNLSVEHTFSINFANITGTLTNFVAIWPQQHINFTWSTPGIHFVFSWLNPSVMMIKKVIKVKIITEVQSSRVAT